MSNIVVGDYILDTEQQLLFQQQQEVAIEPKAFALLLYLYQHRERYVSLEELHQQVWTDRVVSDSAVRSCIKKLRTVLDDHDVRQPRYIKSVAKRGYKLVCPVCEIEAEPAMEAATVADIATTTPALASGSPAIVMAKRPAKLTPWLILSGVALVLLWLLLLWLQASNTAEQLPPSPLASQLPSSLLLSGQHISTPAGEKRGLALSPDGAYLAFLGRSNQSEPWQIYLMDRQSRDIRLLPTAAQQPSLLAFADHQSIFVVDALMGDSTIYRLQLDTAMQLVAEQKVAAFPFIGHLSPATGENSWLINAADGLQKPVTLYRWQWGSDQPELWQARSSAIDHIYRSMLSPSGQRLASAIAVNAVEFRLEIQDLRSSRQILYSVKTLGTLFRLEWLDEESLILLDDKQGLILLDLPSQSQQVIMAHGDEKIEDFSIIGTERRLLVLRNEFLSEPLFYELLPGAGFALDRIVKVPTGIRMVNYAENERYLGVVQDQDTRMLVQYAQHGGSKEVLFSAQQRIELLDYHAKQAALLLKVGQQLMVLNLNTKLIEFVPTSQSLLDHHAAFSLDGNLVYFGQLIAGEWQLHQFERFTQQSRVLLKGYRSLREAPDGYLAATGQGDLYRLDPQLRPIKSLGQRINTEFVSRWYVRQHKLIWSDFDLAYTWLNQLDLVSGELQQRRFAFEEMHPLFAMSQDGSRVLGFSRRTRTTNLVEVDLPAQFFTP
ncbi:winged helix-turn-helix domain-containing protein [Alkalimonas amylolytica]|uniref:DNA-binding winged helix-turn-helix (WHTH) domain-containing protein n=1 Tax=Alkalimonas amylolytica TaxID=152573 RepID=A0A1H4D672_ALKAM|nr:winged helix-turn-helix domain-containing protein [Alkalimonas amylolytica]SEA68036.1 DNA-binding winged helix-turn-helix (wHTH) domain-containing protein [Alkalimonas amylolytica]